MELAITAQRTFVLMVHLAKAGESKLVAQFSCRLTDIGCVCRECTNPAVIDITPAGVAAVGLCEEMDLKQLQALTTVPLRMA